MGYNFETCVTNVISVNIGAAFEANINTMFADKGVVKDVLAKKSAAKIIDLGSGDGRVVYAAAEHGFKHCYGKHIHTLRVAAVVAAFNIQFTLFLSQIQVGYLYI